MASVIRALTSARLAPSLDEIRQLAREALGALPQVFRSRIGDVAILVEDFPDEDVEQEMDLESPFDLLGLYQGVSLAEKSHADAPGDIDRIFLYRRPILDYWCETGETLDHIVRHVLIHEIGHHFGLSDDDMERIEESVENA